ncbi:MAG: response regulator [Acidobacteria bacterium]|nr:response regulator [Acidobacteriota bacterium]
MGKSVLIVDDSASMRQMLKFTLQKAGFAVAEGSDGREGLKQLASARPDLIITDLNMPNMDGLDFIRGVRAQSGFRATPILMLTTESEDGKKQAGKAAGATGWIVKPFQPERLLQVIARVLP